MTPETSELARSLAYAIVGQRRGLAHEEVQAVTPGWKSYARAKKYRDLDAARINGMVIGLTYLLGQPLDMQLAELFIVNDPAWQALLDKRG